LDRPFLRCFHWMCAHPAFSHEPSAGGAKSAAASEAYRLPSSVALRILWSFVLYVVHILLFDGLAASLILGLRTGSTSSRRRAKSETFWDILGHTKSTSPKHQNARRLCSCVECNYRRMGVRHRCSSVPLFGGRFSVLRFPVSEFSPSRNWRFV